MAFILDIYIYIYYQIYIVVKYMLWNIYKSFYRVRIHIQEEISEKVNNLRNSKG